MEVISRAVVVEIYVQQIVVLHVQQLNWQMNLNHKDYGILPKQEKHILEMIVLIQIMETSINKSKTLNDLSIFHIPFFYRCLSNLISI
jgi:hypothetical protein